MFSRTNITRLSHLASRPGLIAILVLSLSCCGCCFTNRADSYCVKFEDYTTILEKQGELSPDGKNFTVHLKKRIGYRRISFGKFDGSVEQSVSHEYSLTRPEPDAKKRLVLKLEPSAETRCQKIKVMSGWDIVNMEEDYSLLILPIINSNFTYSHNFIVNYPKIRESSEQLVLRIHPDDIPLLMKPFIFRFAGYGLSLAIPYKMDGNLCHFYIPKEDLVTDCRNGDSVPNGSQAIMRIILMPPAIILDILTSPVQICIIVKDTFNFLTGRTRWHK